MTDQEVDQKINAIVAQAVSLILSRLMLKYPSGQVAQVVIQLFTSPGYHQRIGATLKAYIEKLLKETEEDLLEVSSGTKVNPVTQQRIIPGFFREEVKEKENEKTRI